MEFGIEHPPIVVEFSVPVEHVHLRHPRCLLERRFRTDADRSGPSGTIGKDRHPGIDTVSREQGPIQIEIRGRNPDGPAPLFTLDDSPTKNVRPSQQARCILDPSELEESADPRTPCRHQLAVPEGDRKLLLHPDLETTPPPKCPQRLHRPRPAATESEVRPFDEPVRRRSQSPFEMVQESLWFERKELQIRGKDQHLVGARLPKQVMATIQRHEWRIRRLAEDHRWWRVEGHRHQTSGIPQNRPSCIKKASMSEVNSVEISDRQA